MDETLEVKLPKNFGNDSSFRKQVEKFVFNCENADETNNDGEKSDKEDYVVITLYRRNKCIITSFRINLKLGENLIEYFKKIFNTNNPPSN